MADELEKPTEEPTADEPLKDAATSDNQAPEVRAESGTEVTNPKRKPPVKILVGVLCAVVLGFSLQFWRMSCSAVKIIQQRYRSPKAFLGSQAAKR